MYLGKLDGRIDNEFFDRKAVEFRNEQAHLMRDIQASNSVHPRYVPFRTGHKPFHRRPTPARAERVH
jgi:hypothetical protein